MAWFDWRWPSAAGCLLVGLVTAAPAEAQTQQEIDWCANKGNPTVDQRIASCTTAIQSGRYAGKNLAWAFTSRCFAYYDLKDFDQAIADCTQAITLDPADPDPYVNRCAANNGKKQYDQAIVDCDQAIQLNRNDPDAYYNRGNAYLNKRDYPNAIASYTESIRVNPSDVSSFVNRAIAQERSGNREAAIADYRSALALGDTRSAEDLRRLGATP